jgi:hypothetical protein
MAMKNKTLEEKDKIIARQKKWIVGLYILLMILLMGLYPIYWFKH